nr:hypothetical protein [Tanacetum cinerariifolium]
SLDEGEAAAERISDDSEEMATILTSMDAATVLAGGIAVDLFPLLVPLLMKFPLAVMWFPLLLPIERKIELNSDLVKYQDNYAKVHKFQSQQRKPWTKKQKRDYYMAVIRSNLGWKVKDFRGMMFEEVKAKFNLVWKQIEDFIPMGSNEEDKRIKKKGLSME